MTVREIIIDQAETRGIEIGVEKGIGIGVEKGIGIGAEKNLEKNVWAMHQKGFPTEQIADVLDVQLSEVHRIIQKMSQAK